MLTPIDAGRRSAMADNCTLVQMAYTGMPSSVAIFYRKSRNWTNRAKSGPESRSL